VNEPIRGPADNPPSYDVRIGGATIPADSVERPQRPARRHRDRIPTMAQLQALLQNGILVLPARYFRGFFLDLLV
jgi:hypothetical protein